MPVCLSTLQTQAVLALAAHILCGLGANKVWRNCVNSQARLFLSVCTFGTFGFCALYYVHQRLTWHNNVMQACSSGRS